MESFAFDGGQRKSGRDVRAWLMISLAALGCFLFLRHDGRDGVRDDGKVCVAVLRPFVDVKVRLPFGYRILAIQAPRDRILAWCGAVPAF